MRFAKSRSFAALTLVVWPAVASGQTLPSEPYRLFGGRVIVGGELRATVAPLDPAYFNASDYNHNLLRLLTLAALVEGRVNDHLAVVADIEDRTALGHIEGGGDRHVLLPYALFVRLRPWLTKPVDIEAGRVPRVFGAFASREYTTANPLIGRPMAYQYLLSLRDDALPASTDDLLSQRGRGWRAEYPIGSTTPSAGLPIVASTQLDTGVLGRWRGARVTAQAAVTIGTASHPLTSDNNDGRQIAGRLTVNPTPGLVLGASAAYGAWISDAALDAVPIDTGDTSFAQRAFGADVEYSWWRVVLRGETIFSDWRLPPVNDPRLDDPVGTRSIMIEGRVTLTPRIYAAARWDRLSFSEVRASSGLERSWEAGVRRVEVGGGYRLRRNVTAKLSWQDNHRGTSRFNEGRFLAAELFYWF
jgi:hypothetical protein